ncbi:zinc finger and BTB domain-containing protein 18-like isoform X2 [Lineus longissimus]|uniref:zinc finger and BTB domain-containing protein 18-like isoform X2 n=1 Tax=Lineus longissimus TaxID=88925 RepID=UPI00315D7A74
MSLLLPEFQEKESQFQNMQVDLQNKGSVLSKAWSDLFRFITNYQAQLTLKENALELAEKEIEIQKKQLEEFKPMIEAANIQAWQVVQLQEQCLSKERLLNEAKCEVKEIEKKFQYMQSELDSNRELFEQSKKELQCRNTQLLLSKQDADHHATQSKIYVDQLAIQNSLVKKFQSQVTKLGMENAELRQKLEAEISKRKTGSNKTSFEISATDAVVDHAHSPVPDNDNTQENIDSDDQITGFEPPIKREKLDPDIRMTPSLVSDASNLPQEPFQFSVISPSASSESRNKKVFSKTWTPVSAQDAEEDEEAETLLNAASDVYFPLSVADDSKSSLMLPSGVMDDVVDQSLLGNSGAYENPVPISEPIPSSEMTGEVKKEDLFESVQDTEKRLAAESLPMFRISPSAQHHLAVDDMREFRIRPPVQKQTCYTSLLGQRTLCDLCGKYYKSVASLKVHKVDVHGDAGSSATVHTCPICDRKFSVKHRFEDHVRSHSGEKGHKCNLCDKKFSVKETMLRHFKRVHVMKKPALKTKLNQEERKDFQFACEGCGKRYKERRYLIEHQTVCLNKRRLKCGRCERQFSWRSSLAKHKLSCEVMLAMESGVDASTTQDKARDVR